MPTQQHATRSNNVLDLVMTSVPNHVRMTDILSPEQSSIVNDHDAISYDFTALLKLRGNLLEQFTTTRKET